jgi:hypothetical protein
LRPRWLLCEAPKLMKKREEEREVIRFGWRVPCWANPCAMSKSAHLDRAGANLRLA